MFPQAETVGRFVFFFQAEDGIRDGHVTGVQTCALPIWQTVKELDKQYMAVQLARIGIPGPKAIGIDEISIRKGHTYRIVVSDLIRHRPIWFGGEDRSEASMDQFYDGLGEKKTRGIRLAVMDMWKPFHNVTTKRAPQAAILFDKFHVMRHLNDALDK